MIYNYIRFIVIIEDFLFDNIFKKIMNFSNHTTMIAQTQNSNSRRITKDLQNSAMKNHMRNIHRKILTRPEITRNVSCISKFDNVKKSKNILSKIDKMRTFLIF